MLMVVDIKQTDWIKIRCDQSVSHNFICEGSYSYYCLNTKTNNINSNFNYIIVHFQVKLNHMKAKIITDKLPMKTDAILINSHCSFLKNHSKNVEVQGYFKCPNSYCIPYKYVCDKTWDCPRGYDEQMCNGSNCSGSFRCQNQTVCISLTKVCDGMPDCFVGDDEIFCHVLCPQQCFCISSGVACPNARFSKIPSFGEKYETTILFLNLEGNLLQLNIRSFLYLENLQYLNISNSNINHLCLNRTSIFLYMQILSILDVSNNNIFTLPIFCVTGLNNLRILYIQQNPLCSIHSNSFFNLYLLPVLKLNTMHLEYLGNYFYCSEFSNNLQILDLSNNKLHILYSKTFMCLSNLKVLLIYGNKFYRFVSVRCHKESAFKHLFC